MKYASSEARKLASKGANYACVEDKVLYYKASRIKNVTSVNAPPLTLSLISILPYITFTVISISLNVTIVNRIVNIRNR